MKSRDGGVIGAGEHEAAVKAQKETTRHSWLLRTQGAQLHCGSGRAYY